MELSGLEPLVFTPNRELQPKCWRKNQCNWIKNFSRLIKEEKFEEAIDIAREQVEEGAQIIDINMDEGMLDGEASMKRFF